MSQSQLVSILYICEACRIIRKFDISMEKLELEGARYKARDMHADHEAILYLNTHYTLESVMLNPPPASPGGPIIKGVKITEAEAKETPVEPFKGANRIFIPTKDITRLPIQFQLQKLILLNMDGKKSLADIFEGLNPEWPDLTPEYLNSVVHQCEVRGWIQEIESKNGG